MASSDEWVTDSSDESLENSSDESDGEYCNCAAKSSGESDAESDVSVTAALEKLQPEDANDWMNKELDQMDQLVADLIAERDRIKRESVVQYQAGVSVGRNPEFVALANKRMEEGHNALTGVWMTPGPINKLPLKIIFKIMQFLPLQQMFVCMSVNRMWQEVALLTVQNHKRVMILKNRFQLQDVIVVNKHTGQGSKLRRLAKSLLLMEKLEVLYAGHIRILELKQINPVIVKNAASLQVLDTNGNLPASRQGPVVYQQLKQLDCRFLNQGTGCPVLEELTIRPCCSLGSVDHLPILTMRKFKYFKKTGLDDEETGFCSLHDDDEGMTNTGWNVFQAVKWLVNLTDLTIVFYPNVGFNATIDDFSTFMDNFRSLVHLELMFPPTPFVFDQKIDRLVRQNPGLRKLIFWGLGLSDAALTSVARLRHLQDLQLRGETVRFTEKGVLTLLRSPLRTLLLVGRFDVHGPTGEGSKEIFEEFDLIAEERGKPLKGQDSGWGGGDVKNFSLEFEN